MKTIMMLDQNNYLVYGERTEVGNPFFYVVTCKSPKGLDLGCTSKTTIIDQQKLDLSKGYKLEDAHFDHRSGVFITAWRSQSENKLVLYSSDTQNDPAKEVINFAFFELKDGEKQLISNRARIETQTKIGGDGKEFTQIYIFDQRTGLETDKNFSTTILSAKIDGSLYKEGSSITLTNDSNYSVDATNFTGQIDPTTISTIYEHEGLLFFASKRLEAKYAGKLCLTKIEVDELPYVYRIYANGYGVVCAEDADGDFFGVSLNNDIVYFNGE